MNRKRVRNDLIFLLGAGATVDAGMPTVAKLTNELRNQLPILSGNNGLQHPEFGQVFDLIEASDPSVAENYERFFEWIKLLLEVHKDPFRKLIHTKIAQSLIKAMAHFSLVVGQEIARLLSCRQTDPSYLARLSDFLPRKGRLKIFTSNYDCCVEDAYRNAGIDITTGFDPTSKKWNSSLFETKVSGINLYKLHGSLRWFRTMNSSLSNQDFQSTAVLMELRPEEHQHLPTNLTIWPHPELVLGPGTKVQRDDPFLALLHEFHKSMQTTQWCVVIGYGYRDSHISTVVDEALDQGITVLDVNLAGPNSKYLGNNCYRHLRASAKSALLDGLISSELLK